MHNAPRTSRTKSPRSCSQGGWQGCGWQLRWVGNWRDALSAGRVPNAANVLYYRQRAGAGLIITEAGPDGTPIHLLSSDARDVSFVNLCGETQSFQVELGTRLVPALLRGHHDQRDGQRVERHPGHLHAGDGRRRGRDTTLPITLLANRRSCLPSQLVQHGVPFPAQPPTDTAVIAVKAVVTVLWFSLTPPTVPVSPQTEYLEDAEVEHPRNQCNGPWRPGGRT